MDEIRNIAIVCVGRAVMFAALAIVCVMVGTSFAPGAAFRAGAVLTLLLAAVLTGKALGAGRKPPQRTEVWLHLDPGSRPTDEHARVLFAIILRDVYGRFAAASLGVAVLLYALSHLLDLITVSPVAASAFG